MPSNNLIEKPAQFFLQDKGNVMNHDDIVHFASSFYTEKEIKDAK